MGVAEVWAAARRRTLGGERHSILDPRSTTRILKTFSDPDSLADPGRFDILAREGYGLNSIVRACVDEIASSAAEPEFVVERRVGPDQWEKVEARGQGQDGRGRQLAKLVADPAGDRLTTPYEWLYRAVQELFIYGNAIGRIRRGTESGTPQSIELLQVPRVEPLRRAVGDPVQSVRLHRYLDRSLITDGAGHIDYPITDIVHFRLPAPLDDFWGLPPMASCLRALDLDDKALDSIRAFFYNAATPCGMLSLKGTTRAEERRALQNEMALKFGGPNAHTPMVVDQDASYQEIGTRPDKLKLDHIFDITESRVCSVFQVPPILIAVRLGIIYGTYANYQSARTSFWREKLRPLYAYICSVLTHRIAKEFGEDFRIRPDLTKVEDLQESEKLKRDWSVTGYKEGILTHHQACAVVGVKPDSKDHYRTRSTDGDPYEPGAMPKPKPLPAPKTAPASRAAASRDASPGAPADDAGPGLTLVIGSSS